MRIEDLQESWVSGHLHYHQSLDPVVRGFVHPLVVSLVKSGQIEAFFFVRDGLGGPHIRLRLRVVPGAREDALAAMAQAARRFLAAEPSGRPVDEETIRRSNERILAADPHEIDHAVYPDNSFRIVPFRPEVQRYGGPERFRASLDFFTLSSVAAIEFLVIHGSASRSAQLAQAFVLLLQQALGFAVDETELTDLLRYGVDSWGEALPRVVERGDQVARSQQEVFLALFHEGLAAAGFLSVGARRLSAEIGDADRVTRARIGGSQLHMTATRLGMSNAEEVYLSRLLMVALREVLAQGEKVLAEGPQAEPGEALAALLAPALAALADLPVSHREEPV